MNPELIKAEIRMKDTTPAAVARGLGVRGACVSHVIYGRGISERVARRICEVTGLTAARMWPGKYPRIP